MKPPENILDALFDAAVEDENFPETEITKRYFEGSHGHSATQDLMIETRSGAVYQITAKLMPLDGTCRSAGYKR